MVRERWSYDMYDQVKCEQFLEDVNKHFSKTKMVNFDIINKSIKGEEISERVLKDYQTFVKEKSLIILFNNERK